MYGLIGHGDVPAVQLLPLHAQAAAVDHVRLRDRRRVPNVAADRINCKSKIQLRVFFSFPKNSLKIDPRKLDKLWKCIANKARCGMVFAALWS